MSNCAPYEIDRQYNRQQISENGTYLEVYLDTPINVCIQRDPKHIYSRYIQGEIQNVLGLDIPFEKPKNPEITLDGSLPLETLIDSLVNEVKERCGF